MTTDTALEYLVAHTPAPIAPVAPAPLRARAALDTAARDYPGIPDGPPQDAWDWDGHEADVGYGVFRASEAVEAASAEIGSILEATGGARRSNAALRVAPATTARWDVHSRLVGLDESKLDTVAREGEWTLRETLGHIVGGQRGYAVFTAWYWSRNSGDRPSDAEREAVEAESG